MLITILAIGALAGAVNLLHWRLRGHRLLYWPTGKVGALVNILLLAQLVLLILAIAGTISTVFFWLATASYATVAAAYSIRHRQKIGIGTTTAV